MDNTDLNQTMQDIMAEMAAVRAELKDLKTRANIIIPSGQPAKPVVSTTRRKVLRRLAGGLLAGLGVVGVAAVLPESAQARLVADPTAPDSSRRVGAIIVPPGIPTPTGIPPGDSFSKFGLVVTDGLDNTFNLNNLPSNGAGIYSDCSVFGIFSRGGNTGIFGSATYVTGVAGQGPTGVMGTGIGSGSTGVYGTGSIGVAANSTSGGASNPALRADNTSSTGIAAIFANNSNDTTLLISNAGTGPLFKAWFGNIPKFQIDNNGTVHTAATYTTGGIDLAEVIPATEKLEPGDVVEIDPDNTGYFRKCKNAGSLAVAGVISTRPGVSLGVTSSEDVENPGPQLALAGRIPVKVTDEGGPIQPGDLLIASATPGHAMRALSPAEQGSVLGKALGRLESGAGTVEMLVMLR